MNKLRRLSLIFLIALIPLMGFGQNVATSADVLGVEEVVNGGFDTDSDWNKTQSTISGGRGHLSTSDGSYTSLLQPGVSTAGKTYRYSLNIDNIVGTISITLGGGTDIDFTTDGTKSGNIVATGTELDIKRKFGITTVSADIDNVSIKEILNPDADNVFTFEGKVLIIN